jgi:phosphatidylinositol phosphate synthase
MTTSLDRLKGDYTQGGRRFAQRLVGSIGDLPLTPNQLTVTGFLLTCVSGALVVTEHFIWATVAYLAGSVIDALDGAFARAHGKMTPFGGFLDSTLDRLSDAVMLGAIGIYLAQQDEMVALACAFAALAGSFMISYTRAKAEALGLKGDVGLMARLERIVLLAIALPLAGYGSLPYVVYLLTALTGITVVQRVAYVHKQLNTTVEE